MANKELNEKKLCPECGKELLKGSKYCLFCGMMISDDSQEESSFEKNGVEKLEAASDISYQPEAINDVQHTGGSDAVSSSDQSTEAEDKNPGQKEDMSSDGQSVNDETSIKHICKNCGKEVSENSRFCNYCGSPIKDGTEGESVTPATNTSGDNLGKPSAEKGRKKLFVVGIVVAALVVGGAVYGFLSSNGVAPSVIKTNYDGTYSGILIDEYTEEGEPYKVTVKDGKMTITAGGSVSGEYEYNDDGDYIELKKPIDPDDPDEDGYKSYVLTKTGGKYYLTMFAGSLGEYTLEVAKGDNPAVTGDKEEIAEKNKSEKESRDALTDELQENYYVIGEDLETGTYDFGPMDDESFFNIDIYDSMDYYKMSYDYDGERVEQSSDYYKHNESYFEDEVVKGISLKKGNVLTVDFRGVKYKKH